MARKLKVEQYSVHFKVSDGTETYYGSVEVSATNIDDAQRKGRLLLYGGHAYQVIGATLLMLGRRK